MCVCVGVCVCARVRACVCVYTDRSSFLGALRCVRRRRTGVPLCLYEYIHKYTFTYISVCVRVRARVCIY